MTPYEKLKLWRSKNKDKVAQYASSYYQRNKDRMRAYRKAWRLRKKQEASA